MAAKKKTTDKSESAVSGMEWTEIPSTATMRWWNPGEDEETALTVHVKSREARETRYGSRAYYICQTLEHSTDEKGELPQGETIVVWESAGLRDLARFCGTGETVRIVPAGRVGRARAYKYFVKGGGQ